MKKRYSLFFSECFVRVAVLCGLYLAEDFPGVFAALHR